MNNRQAAFRVDGPVQVLELQGGGKADMDRKWPTVDPQLEALSSPEIFNIDLSLNFASEMLRSLLAEWERMASDDRLPSRSDFPFENLQPYLGWISLLRVNEARDDVVHTLVGSKVVAKLGRNSTGRTVSEIMHPSALAIYMQLMAHPRPLRTWGPINWLNRDYLNHESLMLPLASDGETVDQFMIMTAPL